MSSNIPPEDPVVRLTDESFNANVLDAEFAALYRDSLQAILRDMDARPGFTTLHRMLAERAAHGFALLKHRDASEAGAALHWQDYERINKIFMEAVKLLLSEAKLQDADDAAKRQIARAMTDAVVDAVDRMQISDDDKVLVLQRLDTTIAEHLV